MPVDGIAEMPLSAIGAYLDRLPARQAELKMIVADAANLPHMGKAERKKTRNAWLRTIQANAKPKPASPAILKLMGIGVRRVK